MSGHKSFLVPVLATVFLGLLLAGSAQAVDVSINVTGDSRGNSGGGVDHLLPAEAAGVVPKTNWNTFIGNPDTGNTANINDGTSQPAGVIVDGTGAATTIAASWGFEDLNLHHPGTAAGPDGKLMNYGGRSWTGGAAPIPRSITLSNLNANGLTTYDAYVYVGLGTTFAAGPVNFTIGDGTTTIAGQTKPGFSGAYTQLPGGGAQGDYALFSGLTADSVTFTITAQAGCGSGVCVSSIQGIQLIGPAEVIPEPSALLLAGMGLVSLASLGWRRRRRQE